MSTRGFVQSLNGHNHRFRFGQGESYYRGPEWEPKPKALFDYAMLHGSGPYNSMWRDDWYLDETDFGVFSFQANISSGLWISISAREIEHTAYHIVLDNGKHQSYISNPSKRLLMASRSDYRLGKHNKARTFWVMYKHGQISIGEGTTPGKSVIMQGTDQSAAPGYQMFGFGRSGTTDPTPGEITQVRTYRKREYRAPLYPYHRTRQLAPPAIGYAHPAVFPAQL